MVMLILRIIGIAVAVVFLGFFVIPMTHGIINPGNIAGTFLSVAVVRVNSARSRSNKGILL